MTELISATIDLEYSEDEGGYYAIEYKMDGSGDARTSDVWRDKLELKLALAMGKINWSDWR